MNDYDDYRGAYQSKERANVYEKGIYAKDGYDDFLWKMERQAFLSILKKSLPTFEKIQTLDFACGTGRISEFLEGKFESIDAIDISDEMVQIAKSKTDKVNYIVADITKDDAAFTKKYDLITTFRFVLFSEPDLRKEVFAKLATFLKDKDARLVVGLHGNPFSRRGFVHIFQKLKGLPAEKQLRSFSLSDMQALAAHAGLEIVDYTGVGFVPRKVFNLFGAGFCGLVERAIYKLGIFKYFGSNLIVVCKLAE
jgi:SAM-dependent methyltransferase